MSNPIPAIDNKIRDWVSAQRMFFVSTAPLSGGGHVNCSPKGMDTLRILDDHTVAYLDLTGSGAETIAHLRENGRILIMMCALEGAPKIVRFHGSGKAFIKGSDEYSEHIEHFDELPGSRAIIKIDITRISDSCGYSIPLYEHVGERDQLIKWAEVKKPEGVTAFQQAHNLTSLDELPALQE